MTNTDLSNEKRGFFQFQRATLSVVVLMICILIPLQVVDYWEPTWVPGHYAQPRHVRNARCKGWPFTIRYETRDGDRNFAYVYPFAILLNLGVSLLIVFAAAFLSEWVISRRSVAL